MIVEFSPRARREASRQDAWWRAHRPSAPGVFEGELARAVRQIATAPQSGIAVELGGAEHRRIILRVTQVHLYWRNLSEGRARVTAVWSARRGRGPAL